MIARREAVRQPLRRLSCHQHLQQQQHHLKQQQPHDLSHRRRRHLSQAAAAATHSPRTPGGQICVPPARGQSQNMTGSRTPLQPRVMGLPQGRGARRSEPDPNSNIAGVRISALASKFQGRESEERKHPRGWRGGASTRGRRHSVRPVRGGGGGGAPWWI